MNATVPSSCADLRRPWPDLVDPATTALFLDIDGTLLDMAPTPSSVAIPTQLIELLRQTHEVFNGAVAILTGRQISEADNLLYPLRLVGSGVHGCEIRRENEGTIVSQPSSIDEDLLTALFALVPAIPGVVVEPKGPGVAVHYRLAPLRRREIESRVRGLVADRTSKLVVSVGRMVIEIIPPGRSKGTALETILALPPFLGRTPVMIGDDVGDEPAFAIAAHCGGAGLKVAGEHFDRDVADFGGPADVRAWLGKLIDRYSDQRCSRECSGIAECQSAARATEAT